jgi:hypothetical protein
MTDSALVQDTDNAGDAIHLCKASVFQVAKRDILYRKPIILQGFALMSNRSLRA